MSGSSTRRQTSNYCICGHRTICACVCAHLPTNSCMQRELSEMLPVRASEQGNVIGLVTVYIYVTGSEKRYIVAHIFKIELLAPRGRVSSQL